MSEKKKKLFPKLKKKISDFLTDESWEITKKDALGIAAGATVFASFQTVDALWWRDWNDGGDYWSWRGRCYVEKLKIKELEAKVIELENEKNDLNKQILWNWDWDIEKARELENINSIANNTNVNSDNEVQFEKPDWKMRWSFGTPPPWMTYCTIKIPSTHISWIVNWHISVLPFNGATLSHGSHWSHGSHGSHWSRW